MNTVLGYRLALPIGCSAPGAGEKEFYRSYVEALGDLSMCNCILGCTMTAFHRRHWWRKHFLTLAASATLVLWIALYARLSLETHAGSFFGNAIADWRGLVVMVMVMAIKHCMKNVRQRASSRGASCPTT